MEKINVEIENNVHTITLNNGKVNAITHQLVECGEQISDNLLSMNEYI